MSSIFCTADQAKRDLIVFSTQGVGVRTQQEGEFRMAAQLGRIRGPHCGLSHPGCRLGGEFLGVAAGARLVTYVFTTGGSAFARPPIRVGEPVFRRQRNPRRLRTSGVGPQECDDQGNDQCTMRSLEQANPYLGNIEILKICSQKRRTRSTPNRHVSDLSQSHPTCNDCVHSTRRRIHSVEQFG